MRAGDIMTADMISVEPDAAIMQAIRLMLQNRISGLPVVTPEGKLVGIVSEGDLLRRAELGTQRRRPRWLEFLIGPGQLANEYVHACGRKVREVMTTDVQTITENTPLDETVALMERHHIKRVPVMRGEKPVGIVTRANLMRALASIAAEAHPTSSDDATAQQAIMAEIKKQPWGPIALVDVVVRDGVAHLWGTIMDDRQRQALVVVAENTPA